MDKIWHVYLSGEIHTDWREQIEDGARTTDLPAHFTGPVSDHATSDDCGIEILLLFSFNVNGEVSAADH